MKVQRYDITDTTQGRPCMSRVVVHGDTVYISGVTPDPEGDIKTQTRQVLDRIDGYLKIGGTDKSKLLSAQVWLTDMENFSDMNSVWNDWVDRNNPPVRACVSARLRRPDMMIEIMVTAAR
jgi:enamine deaminase RidA (YjgF/YER057c/UK114 family)